MNNRAPYVATVVALSLLGLACSGDGESTTSVNSFEPDRNDAIPLYSVFDDCEDVVDWTKTEMLKRVTPYGLDMYPIY